MLSWMYGPPLPSGSLAPDWTLPDQDGNQVTLSALRGRHVVLVFYPRDETPVCRTQLCEFRDRSELAATAGVSIFGINPGDEKSHASFRERLGLPYPLLVDEGGRVARLYRCRGILWPVRTVYLVGPDGRIRFSQRGKPSPETVLAHAT